MREVRTSAGVSADEELGEHAIQRTARHLLNVILGAANRAIVSRETVRWQGEEASPLGAIEHAFSLQIAPSRASQAIRVVHVKYLDAKLELAKPAWRWMNARVVSCELRDFMPNGRNQSFHVKQREYLSTRGCTPWKRKASAQPRLLSARCFT